MNDETNIIRYQLDAGQSRFTVQAFASGLLSGLGHNPIIGIRDFTGEAQCAPGTLANASLRLAINPGSLIVLDDIKEKDRQEIERAMHNDVLETARYPEIIFESANIAATRIVAGRYKARIVGDLTLHGVTRNALWIQAQVNVNEDGLSAQGEFTLKQTDYGIKPVSFAGGALKLKDELKFSFDVIGHKEQG
ncbi:MAG: YceI family protein [Acidobacteriota bacterium]|nr:YceI family protein [Acidobacteriota bacterium]